MSNSTQLSKATQRRESKLAQQMRDLALSNPARFKQKWQETLCCWSLEAISRGRLLQQEHTDGPQLPVFGVLQKAERLLALCGSAVERMVGAKTRELLSHDCGKAFALAVEPHLFWLVNAAHNEQLMKLGTHRRPR